MTGQSQTSLSEKLEKRMSEQLAEVEQLTSEQLAQLARSMTKHTSAALSTTQSDIDRLTESIKSSSLSCGELNEGLTQTLSKIEQQAQNCQISETMQAQLRNQLQQQINQTYGQAISSSLKPLKRELAAVQNEALALSQTTLKSWLKPLLIGASVAIGAILAAVGGTLGLDSLISSRAQQLSELNREISVAEQLSRNLPVGVQLQRFDGQLYLTGLQLGLRQELTNGHYAVKLNTEN